MRVVSIEVTCSRQDSLAAVLRIDSRGSKTKVEKPIKLLQYSRQEAIACLSGVWGGVRSGLIMDIC